SGKHDIAERLQVAGAVVEPTDVDRFLGACLNADRDLAAQLLATRPGLANDLTDDDRAVIVDAAGSRSAATVRLLLDMGFPADARRFGEVPLHAAAYSGNAPVVGVLLEAGAEVDARDDRFDATPLAFATVGSREQAGKAGDWIVTVHLLVDAGACRTDVWVSGKPPSEEVMNLLRSYGIGPEQPAEPRPEKAGEPGELGSIETASMGSETLAEVARHLEAAYRERDLDLLGSLFHPEVHWTGVCTNRSEVLDWYRGLLSEGMQAAVDSVEFDRDAIILELAVGRTAEGARAAPLEHLYQVFTVDGAQVVDIHGYPDRASALRRS
ncbi:MAG: ankyrin repeat domain-containing protein, partial [Acidimicrobiales bacterium]